jgi:hypothetical protein
MVGWASPGEQVVATDDNRFQRLIEQYLTNNGWQHDKCCGTVERAFRQVQEYRQKKGNSLDLDYAAAEHYLFARFMVCTGTISQTQMKALSAGYDAKKLLDRARGEPNKEAVTGNPVSPPSWHVLRWGMKGAVEGRAVQFSDVGWP